MGVSRLLVVYFYPRPPRGGRLPGLSVDPGNTSEFLSTPSARRATLHGLVDDAGLVISIHALREEGDATKRARAAAWRNFYPRPPRGGRQYVDAADNALKVFLSTPSARRATPHHRGRRPREAISIHALREEGDTRALLPS